MGCSDFLLTIESHFAEAKIITRMRMMFGRSLLQAFAAFRLKTDDPNNMEEYFSSLFPLSTPFELLRWPFRATSAFSLLRLAFKMPPQKIIRSFLCRRVLVVLCIPPKRPLSASQRSALLYLVLPPADGPR